MMLFHWLRRLLRPSTIESPETQPTIFENLVTTKVTLGDCASTEEEIQASYLKRPGMSVHRVIVAFVEIRCEGRVRLKAIYCEITPADRRFARTWQAPQ